MKAARLSLLPEERSLAELKLLRKPVHHGFVRRHLFAFCTVAVVAMGLAWIGRVYGQQEALLKQLRHEAVRLNDGLNQARAQNAALAQQVKLLESDAYLEMLARERLGLVKPGETPFTTRTPGG